VPHPPARLLAPCEHNIVVCLLGADCLGPARLRQLLAPLSGSTTAKQAPKIRRPKSPAASAAGLHVASECCRATLQPLTAAPRAAPHCLLLRCHPTGAHWCSPQAINEQLPPLQPTCLVGRPASVSQPAESVSGPQLPAAPVSAGHSPACDPAPKPRGQLHGLKAAWPCQVSDWLAWYLCSALLLPPILSGN